MRFPPPGPLYSSTDASAAALVADTSANWAAYVAGVAVGGGWEDFRAAVALGWPDSPLGFDQFLYYFTAPTGDVIPNFPEFAGWIAARQLAAGMRSYPNRTADDVAAIVEQSARAFRLNGVPTAAVDEYVASFNRYFPDWLRDLGISLAPVAAAPVGNLIPHPVIPNAFVDPASIAFHGPDPDGSGMMILELTNGDTWRYAGPNFVAPVERTRLDVTAEYVTGTPPADSSDPRRYVEAIRYTTHYSDGSTDRGGWEYWAGWIDPAVALAGTGYGVRATAVTPWADLSAADQSAIRADLDDYARAAIAAGAIQPTPIPQEPGSVTIVPAPGSTDPITHFPATGGAIAIPTATSTPGALPVTPPQSWWDAVVAPTGAPTPGAPNPNAGAGGSGQVVVTTAGDPVPVAPGGAALPGLAPAGGGIRISPWVLAGGAALVFLTLGQVGRRRRD